MKAGEHKFLSNLFPIILLKGSRGAEREKRRRRREERIIISLEQNGRSAGKEKLFSHFFPQSQEISLTPPPLSLSLSFSLSVYDDYDDIYQAAEDTHACTCMQT